MYVYIMGNDRPTLYTGVTNDLVRRVYEHREELTDGFTKRYKLRKLLYYEVIDGEFEAIIREKQVKDMNRIDKLIMIRELNPRFVDLYSSITEDSGRAGLARMTNKNE